MILKFQQGGASLPPLVSYQPVTVTGGGASSSDVATTSSKSSDLTDKDLLQMLEKLDGLPSDMQVLTQTLKNFYIDQQYDPMPNTSSITSRYLQVLNDLKVANFNKKEYDAAFEIVSKNGSINEYAINERGQLYCINDKGDFKLLSLEQLQNSESYTPLTNSELLYYRAQVPEMANQNGILKVVQNGISIESITKLINQAVTMLGSTSKQDEGYIRSDAKRLISGLQDYIKAANNSQGYNASIDSLYKTNMLSKSYAEQASLAINYIWDTLPINAKTLLRTKTKNGTNEEAKELIGSLILSRTSSTQNFSVDMETIQGKSTKGNSGSAGEVDNDPVKAFILGKGYSQPISINLGNSYTHTVNGRYGILVDKSGNAIGANSTLEDVSKSAYAGVLDMNSATFGGIKLNTNQGRKILLDSADIIGMDLPIDQEAREANGIIRPDLNLLVRMEQADSEIRDNNITDPEEINEIYHKYDLPEKFKNEDGSYNLNTLNYQRFARISGVVEESALPEDVDLNETVEAITDDAFRTSIEEVLQSKDKNYSMSGGVFGWGATELYRGAIYIPVREDLIAASLGSGDYYSLPGKDATQTQKDWAQAQKVNNYVKPPSLGVQ